MKVNGRERERARQREGEIRQERGKLRREKERGGNGQCVMAAAEVPVWTGSAHSLLRVCILACACVWVHVAALKPAVWRLNRKSGSLPAHRLTTVHCWTPHWTKYTFSPTDSMQRSFTVHHFKGSEEICLFLMFRLVFLYLKLYLLLYLFLLVLCNFICVFRNVVKQIVFNVWTVRKSSGSCF